MTKPNTYLDIITVEGECSHCSAGKHVGKSVISRVNAVENLGKARTECQKKAEARAAYLAERKRRFEDSDTQPGEVVES